MDEIGHIRKIFSNLNSLNWRLVISLDPRTDISRSSIKYGLRSEVGMDINKSPAEVNLYFVNDAAHIDRNTSMLISRLSGSLEGNVWRIKRIISQTQFIVGLLKKLLEIPSCILTSIWLDRGRYYMELIFNYSEMGKISRALLNTKVETGKYDIEFIGPSKNYEDLLRDINVRTRLSVLQVASSKDSEMLKNKNFNVEENRWIKLSKKSMETDNSSGVYFKDGEVIMEDKISVQSVQNHFIEALNKEISRKKIVTIATIEEYDFPHFRTYMIMPTIFTDSVLKIFIDTSRLFKDLNLNLEKIQSLEEWLDKP